MQCNSRVAPALHNQRKTVCSNEDPAQPKIKKKKFFKGKAIVTESKGCQGLGDRIGCKEAQRNSGGARNILYVD